MKKEDYRKLAWVSVFAIAFGLLEAAVVVYLRKIYYPAGFEFALTVVNDLLHVELFREIATLIMLVSIGILVGRTFNEKLAYFIYGFAVWDIFYYVFLKLFLDWPASLMTWDLLFLVPIPWIGPVLSPLLCAVAMVAFALLLIKYPQSKLKAEEWGLLIIGSLIILYTWMYDFGKIIIEGGFIPDILNLTTNTEFAQIVESYIPTVFNWPLFLIGFALLIIPIYRFYLRNN